MSETTPKSWVNSLNSTPDQLTEQQVFYTLLLTKYRVIDKLKSINEEIDRKELDRCLITQSMKEPYDN